MHVMARETWTDERLDDLTKHMDESFCEVREDLREQRERMDKMMVKQERMDARFDAYQKNMDTRFDDLNRTMQIGFSFIGLLLVALIGLIGAQL
ncbi:MAG TPA: hypothetical protein VLI94_08725 [Solirubrobacterales bacterium]|nr:hypothetical protein [Solirubrobacterales bacterium]